MKSTKYPNLIQHVNNDSLFPEIPRIRKFGNKFTIVFMWILETAFVINIVVDLVKGKETGIIVLDVIFALLYGALLFTVYRIDKRGDEMNKAADDLDRRTKLASTVSTVAELEALAKHSRAKYYAATDLALENFSKTKKSVKDYIDEHLEEELKNTQDILCIILNNPKVLKEQAELDRKELKLVEYMDSEFKRIREMNEEERTRLQKDYEHKAKMRDYSRKWSKKNK